MSGWPWNAWPQEAAALTDRELLDEIARCHPCATWREICEAELRRRRQAALSSEPEGRSSGAPDALAKQMEAAAE